MNPVRVLRTRVTAESDLGIFRPRLVKGLDGRRRADDEYRAASEAIGADVMPLRTNVAFCRNP
jgi:hypothetical protein